MGQCVRYNGASEEKIRSCSPTPKPNNKVRATGRCCTRSSSRDGTRRVKIEHEQPQLRGQRRRRRGREIDFHTGRDLRESSAVRDGTGVSDPSSTNYSRRSTVWTPRINIAIGMTNRKDMIDEAISPGRLELRSRAPDEKGRLQILDIKTARASRKAPARCCGCATRLAGRTKNFPCRIRRP